MQSSNESTDPSKILALCRVNFVKYTKQQKFHTLLEAMFTSLKRLRTKILGNRVCISSQGKKKISLENLRKLRRLNDLR